MNCYMRGEHSSSPCPRDKVRIIESSDFLQEDGSKRWNIKSNRKLQLNNRKSQCKAASINMKVEDEMNRSVKKSLRNNFI